MNKAWVAAMWFVVGIITIPSLFFVYLRYGSPPVAVTDTAFPMEKTIVHIPLNARIDRERPADSPIQATPEHLEAGAVIYKQQCSFCHGLPQKPSSFGANMYPAAPQLWQSHRADVVGVSDDPVGETYWKVKHGIRLSGMPAYAKLLSEQEMWQVSVLLVSAAKPLPPQIQSELAHP